MSAPAHARKLATIDSLIGVAWGLLSIGAFVWATVNDNDRALAVGFAAAALCVLYRILGALEASSEPRP